MKNDAKYKHIPKVNVPDQLSQSISSDQLLGSQNGPNLDSPKTNFLLQESYESFCGGFSFQNINFGE